MPTVVIVDDHDLLAETVRLALRERGVDAVRAVPTSAEVLLADVIALRAPLVLLDLDLGPAGDATGLVAPLAASGSRVLLVTGVDDRLRIAGALEQGAVGWHAKADSLDALLSKIDDALGTDEPLEPQDRLRMFEELARARALHTADRAPFERLTTREQHTLRELARGRSVHEIARAWVVSDATVRSHVRSILGKLEVGSQLAAVTLALSHGWLDGPL